MPALGNLALPNLEAVDDAPDAGRTLGFGPVHPAAATRRALLHPERWRGSPTAKRARCRKGFDFAFYNAAPRDQQIDLLRHSASIVLDEPPPRAPALRRQAAPRAPADVPRLRRRASAPLEIALRCDTLWIDTDRAVMTLSWRGLVGIGTPEAEGLETLVVAAESKGKELRYKHIQRMLRDGVSVSLDEDLAGETHPLGLRHDRVRGSAGSTATPSAASSRRPPEPAPAPEPEPAPSRDDTTGESEAKTLERRLPPGLARRAGRALHRGAARRGRRVNLG